MRKGTREMRALGLCQFFSSRCPLAMRKAYELRGNDELAFSGLCVFVSLLCVFSKVFSFFSFFLKGRDLRTTSRHFFSLSERSKHRAFKSARFLYEEHERERKRECV